MGEGGGTLQRISIPFDGKRNMPCCFMLHKGKPTEHTSPPDESLLLACCRLNKKASNLKCYRNNKTRQQLLLSTRTS